MSHVVPTKKKVERRHKTSCDFPIYMLSLNANPFIAILIAELHAVGIRVDYYWLVAQDLLGKNLL